MWCMVDLMTVTCRKNMYNNSKYVWKQHTILSGNKWDANWTDRRNITIEESMASHMMKGIWCGCVLLLCTRTKEGSYIYFGRGHIKSFDEFRKWLIVFNMFLVGSAESWFILIVSSHVHLTFNFSYLIHPALCLCLLRPHLLQQQSSMPHLFRHMILLHLPPLLVTRVEFTESPTIVPQSFSQ